MDTTNKTSQGGQVAGPFRTERAAKLAMTKAERAYVTALGAVGSLRWDYQQGGMLWDDFLAREKLLEAAKDAAAAHAQSVYDQAEAQGFRVSSWHFGPNPTRDIISANMD